MRTSLSFAGLVLGAALLVGGLVLSRPPTAPFRPDEVAAIAPVASGTPQPTGPSASGATPTPAPTPPAKLGNGWRIKIARVGIDLPIRDGDVMRDIDLQETPDGAAYTLAGSALPGASGNTYIYGHARWAQFIGLWYAHLDDLVVITGPGTTLYYRVTEIHPRVATDDLTYLLPSANERLTLQTSTGPDPGDPRFVVIALPVRP